MDLILCRNLLFVIFVSQLKWISISGQDCKPQIFPTPGDLIQGKEFRLNCEATNCDLDTNFKIIWQRKHDVIFTDVYKYDHSDASNIGLEDLELRSRGEMVGDQHRLYITARLIDSGEWRCMYDKEVSQNVSDPTTIDILVIPNENDITLNTMSPVVAGTNKSFSCSVENVKPRFESTWKWNGKLITNVDTRNTENIDGETWKFNTTAFVKIDNVGNQPIECALNDISGGMHTVTKSKIEKVYASAFVENITGSENDITISDGLQITCIATGSDVTIVWYLDDVMIQESIYNVTDTQVPGGYRYGQDTALKSIVVWNAKSNRCGELENITGNYMCRAKASVGERISSTPRSVNLLYKPSTYTVHSTVEEKVKLDNNEYRIHCSTHICANPTVHTYLWTVESGDKPDGITGWDSSTLVIDAIAEQHTNRKYICNATNSVGHGHVTVLLSIDTTPDGPNVGAIVGGCLAGAALCGCVAGAVILYKKKKKQQADQEVVAYAESNTPNATNGANAASKGTTVASPVYSEVNKNNKQPKKEEPTGPVYSQVNKSGRPLPQLQPKPSTDTGPVYSEVKKPKQGRLTPIEKQHYDNAGQSNDHGGIHYADVDFLRQSNGNKQSHGTKNPAYEHTEYAQIDHRKSSGIVV